MGSLTVKKIDKIEETGIYSDGDGLRLRVDKNKNKNWVFRYHILANQKIWV